MNFELIFPSSLLTLNFSPITHYPFPITKEKYLQIQTGYKKLDLLIARAIWSDRGDYNSDKQPTPD